mmetsp:Transcript_67384/g.135778  ORF Transcript_67384/g.135778 Transcript_67384/m.135778 type:complete len:210 (-) Transcript_67384:281-910(-)
MFGLPRASNCPPFGGQHPAQWGWAHDNSWLSHPHRRHGDTLLSSYSGANTSGRRWQQPRDARSSRSCGRSDGGSDGSQLTADRNAGSPPVTDVGDGDEDGDDGWGGELSVELAVPVPPTALRDRTAFSSVQRPQRGGGSGGSFNGGGSRSTRGDLEGRGRRNSRSSVTELGVHPPYYFSRGPSSASCEEKTLPGDLALLPLPRIEVQYI